MSSLDLARWQFAITTVYHFIFVPITIGLGFLVAGLQTAWNRTGNAKYLKATKFFGKLFLINFAMGVVTGIVQEFQFGMKVLVEYRLDWVPRYLTTCAALSSVCLEELVKRTKFGMGFPMLEYIAYVALFGNEVWFVRLLPLCLHYIWMSMPLQEAIICHLIYNLLADELERRYRTALLASVADLVQEHYHVVLLALYFVVRCDALTYTYYWLICNWMFVEQLLIVLYIAYVVVEK